MRVIFVVVSFRVSYYCNFALINIFCCFLFKKKYRWKKKPDERWLINQYTPINFFFFADEKVTEKYFAGFLFWLEDHFALLIGIGYTKKQFSSSLKVTFNYLICFVIPYTLMPNSLSQLSSLTKTSILSETSSKSILWHQLH